MPAGFNEGEIKGETSVLLDGLVQIRSDRDAALEAIGDSAYTSKSFLLKSLGIDIDYLSRDEDDDTLSEFTKDMLALTEVFDDLLESAHRASAEGRDLIGPVKIPASESRYRKEGESYVGGLMLAARAWGRPILIYIDDVNVRVASGIDRQEAVGAYRQKIKVTGEAASD